MVLLSSYNLCISWIGNLWESHCFVYRERCSVFSRLESSGVQWFFSILFLLLHWCRVVDWCYVVGERVVNLGWVTIEREKRKKCRKVGNEQFSMFFHRFIYVNYREKGGGLPSFRVFQYILPPLAKKNEIVALKKKIPPKGMINWIFLFNCKMLVFLCCLKVREVSVFFTVWCREMPF